MSYKIKKKIEKILFSKIIIFKKIAIMHGREEFAKMYPLLRNIIKWSGTL